MKEMRLNPQQQEAITHRDGPMIVLSVVGSGKTLVLTERIIHLIENGIDPAQLLAITFAKKAVLEIQSRLEKRLNGNGAKALVCTFHSLGYRILKAQNSLAVGCKLVHDADQLNLNSLNRPESVDPNNSTTPKDPPQRSNPCESDIQGNLSI